MRKTLHVIDSDKMEKAVRLDSTSIVKCVVFSQLLPIDLFYDFL